MREAGEGAGQSERGEDAGGGLENVAVQHLGKGGGQEGGPCLCSLDPQPQPPPRPLVFLLQSVTHTAPEGASYPSR